MPVCQQGLKRELPHLGKTTRLGEGQPLLLEKRLRKFDLQLRLGDMTCGELFV